MSNIFDSIPAYDKPRPYIPDTLEMFELYGMNGAYLRSYPSIHDCINSVMKRHRVVVRAVRTYNINKEGVSFWYIIDDDGVIYGHIEQQ